MVKVAVGEKDGLRLQTLVLEPLGQLLPLAAGVDDAAGSAARLVEDIAVGAQLTQGEDVDLHEITSESYAPAPRPAGGGCRFVSISYDILGRL